MGVAHQVGHLVGEAGQLVVELLDLVGAHPQHRVRVLANLRQGDTTACSLLRVELSLVPLVVAVVFFRGSAALRRHDTSLVTPHRTSVTQWGDQSDCGSTSTTALTPARRIAGAAAARSWPAREASARG